MARPKSSVGYKRIHILIPLDIYARVEALAWDPYRQKPRHGAIGKIMVKALQEYADTHLKAAAAIEKLLEELHAGATEDPDRQSEAGEPLRSEDI